MVSGDEGAKEATGTNPLWPTGPVAAVMGPAVNLAVAPEALEGPEAPLLTDPADTDDEKARQNAFQLIMQGFHASTRTLSEGYQQVCKEVQTLVRRSLRKSTTINHMFVWGASATIHWLVKTVQPAMHCMGESLEEQSRLLQMAWQAGKEATEDILALLPVEESPYLTPVVPKEDIPTLALQATWTHMEKAIEAINVQLLALVHCHVPPQQAGVFLTSLLCVICSYQQEMDGMAASQVILPSQIVPNLWGVSWTMMEGLTLLGPLNCPTSWPASLVEQVSAKPVNKAMLVRLTTLVKRDTSVPSKGKLHPGSSGKKLAPPKQIIEYSEDNERKKEDEESLWWEEERHQKKPSGPVLSLDKHEELVMLLTSKAAPSLVSQGSGLPPHAPSEGKRSRSKVWRASPIWFNSSEDEPLSDKTSELEPKSRKKDHTTPELMIVDNDDDPLPERPKGTGKKDKSRAYTQDELDSLDSLLLWLKSKAQSIQYTMETAGLTKYRNDHVPGLKGAPNTDDHSAYLAEVKKESWSYPAKGILCTIWQFVKELEGCPDAEKRLLADKTLQDKGIPRIPQEKNSVKGGKRELIKARYMMKVLPSIEGETIDTKHPDFSRDQNIGLYDIVCLASMRKVERNGQIMVRQKSIKGSVDYGYGPLCQPASQNHWTLNNHVRLHFLLSMACRMPDCWYITHSMDSMWKHATKHGLHTAEPITINPPKKR